MKHDDTLDRARTRIQRQHVRTHAETAAPPPPTNPTTPPAVDNGGTGVSGGAARIADHAAKAAKSFSLQSNATESVEKEATDKITEGTQNAAGLATEAVKDGIFKAARAKGSVRKSETQQKTKDKVIPEQNTSDTQTQEAKGQKFQLAQKGAAEQTPKLDSTEQKAYPKREKFTTQRPSDRDNGRFQKNTPHARDKFTTAHNGGFDRQAAAQSAVQRSEQMRMSALDSARRQSIVKNTTQKAAKKTGQAAAKKATAAATKAAASGAGKAFAVGAAASPVGIIVFIIVLLIGFIIAIFSGPLSMFFGDKDGEYSVKKIVSGVTSEWNGVLDNTTSRYEGQEYVVTVFYNAFEDSGGVRYNNWRDVLSLYMIQKDLTTDGETLLALNETNYKEIKDMYFSMNTVDVETWEEIIETEVEVEVPKTRWIQVGGKWIQETYYETEIQIVEEIVNHADIHITNMRYTDMLNGKALHEDQVALLEYLMSDEAIGLWEMLGLTDDGGFLPGMPGGEGIDGFIFPLHNHAVHNCGFVDTFGAPRDGGKRGHSGVDISSAEGDPIYSPVDGVVVTNKWNGTANPGGSGGGWEISVQDAAGYTYKCLHMMQQSTLTVGTQVTAGMTVLGYVGHTGNNITVDHLHMSITDPSGQYIDPYPILRAAHDVY